MLEIFSVTVSICWFRTLQQTTILLSLIWWNSLFHHIFIALYNTITINFFWSAFKFSYFYPLLWSDNNHQSLSLSWSIRFLDISKILIRYVVLFLYSFFFLIIISLFLAVLGLHFSARAFSSCGEQGPLFIAVRGPLTITASLVAEHKLQTRRLSSCGSRA